MAIYDIYSKRKARSEGIKPDVYSYATLPSPLKVQVQRMADASFSNYALGASNGLFGTFRDMLCMEYGMYSLVKRARTSAFDELIEFLHASPEAELNLDVIELIFKGLTVANDGDLQIRRSDIPRVIADLNYRFLEHGVGFQFEMDKIIRIDSKLLHSEVTKPALALLSDPLFKGANDEFVSAHSHYRAGHYEECLVECCKAFESTMKSICDAKKWVYDPAKDTAQKLIGVLIANGLCPSFMDQHLTGLRTTLESGAPTLRNKLAGHGQGSTVREIPAHTAAYALHLTATNVVFLVEAFHAMK